MIGRLLCRLNIHFVPQVRHSSGLWIWGSCDLVRTKNPIPYCVYCELRGLKGADAKIDAIRVLQDRELNETITL